MLLAGMYHTNAGTKDSGSFLGTAVDGISIAPVRLRPGNINTWW
jgi:hypothetical protein